MPLPKKIINFLEKNKIKYQPVDHKTVYTAFDKAQTLKMAPKMIGKTLVMKVGQYFVLAMIPGNKNLCKVKFKKLVNKKLKEQDKKTVKKIDFAKENWIIKNIKGVKVGAVPPFGSLWEMSTFVDKFLLRQPKIIIPGGNYNFSIKLNPSVLDKKIPDVILGSFSRAKK
jgi:prolyl-tRNA editing enzyme YbaK/EbsC (Cys-tRNA(Pro) deacylase)